MTSIVVRCCSLVFVAIVCYGLPSAAQESSATILRTEAVVFPEYESYRNIEHYASTRGNYEEAISDERFVMEKVTYRSDGLQVYAYLYRPIEHPANGEKLPVVIFNRGSYVRNEFAPEVLLPGRRLAEAGYLVIAPMLRGSGGADGHDEMGGADVDDILNIEAVLRELRYADLSRIFLYGESRGGIMSLLAAKRGFPARAVATWGAITDLAEYVREGGQYRGLGAQIWAGFPENEAEIVESRSALYWPEQIRLPVLIMNGGSDADVPARHALKLAEALQNLAAPYELKIFFGEGHLAGARAAERDADAVRWFRRFDSAVVPDPPFP
jgi:dipeptidyl aminopeptidase/acylaminoacyl peptidase